MVEKTTTDGTRIAELLSSEIHGHERGGFARLSVAGADIDAEPTEAGAFAYGVDFDSADDLDPENADDIDPESAADVAVESTEESTERIAEVYLHSDRVRIEFRAGLETAVEAARDAGLRVRPKAVDPPKTLVFVERGAEVKPALGVFRAVAEERLDDGG